MFILVLKYNQNCVLATVKIKFSIADRMEAQLRQYRARQRRQAILDTAKQQYEKSKAKLIKLVVPTAIFEDMAKKREEHALLMEKEAQEAQAPPLPGKKPIQPFDEFDLSDLDEERSMESFDGKCIRPCTYCIFRGVTYFIAWLFIWGLFLHYQFGAVYFVVTALIAIYLNTRTRPKRQGEVSAYSVFNENCASIEGTINPQQFENEIRYGIGHVGSQVI
ncbi:hypothetical protein PYW08_007793 [Mythimna loreyi]|uniref:Uncharacterized protein n=1 Tax=Mythimna loreyi TaxID=667449 RepID=A0ACC2QF88_9NEOP|nr:hypothetical protein PYW08_007793 [Mythimna loreyi]